MISDLLNKIIRQEDLRQNLIRLKEEIKTDSNKTALLLLFKGDYSLFDTLLQNEDAKIRKNAALIMSELAVPSFLDKLLEAYCKEEQLFVKSSYLIGMKTFDYGRLLPFLKERLSLLETVEVGESDRKHVGEEIRALSQLILQKEGNKAHTFTGYNVESEVILLTNRNFKELTSTQLKHGKAKEFNAGVLLKTNDLKEAAAIRTWGELLFALEDLKVCKEEPLEAAKAIAASSLLDFLQKRHTGMPPFYFRIELKSKMELDKKSIFTKKLGMELERLTKRKLINTTSNYEFELRLIENKTGDYNLLIKLYTLKDDRFSYRKNSISSSIQPVNAALIAALSKEYLEENARILDPFCGVGTMLIERNHLVCTNAMYGLDIYGEALVKAKENTEAAKVIVYYINRDFFDFTHEYLFDEIITDMPRALGHKDEEEIYELYRKFFKKAPSVLKKGAVLILYSHNREYVKKMMDPGIYRLEKEYEISRKEGAYLYIIRYL